MFELDIPSFFSSLVVQTKSGPITLPCLDIQRGEGEVVLITAGMDGDEYDGIQAAIQLGKQFTEDLSWKGRRVIFPIVNLPGLLAGVSFNPLDSKYPKHIYPGKENGTVSEQILFSIVQYSQTKFDLWIDLHGGGRVETLYPFVWVFSGGSSVIQENIKAKLSNLDESTTIIVTKWKKATDILHDDCMYLMLEAGHKGTVDINMTQQLIQWTNKLLKPSEQNKVRRSIFSSIIYYSALSSGYWKPAIDSMLQQNGNNIGSNTPFYKPAYEYKVRKDCRILWFREAGWVKQNEVLVAAVEKSSSQQ